MPDIAELTFKVDNSEGLKRIREIDASMKKVGESSADFLDTISKIGSAFLKFKAFDKFAQASDNLNGAIRGLSNSLDGIVGGASKIGENLQGWVKGSKELTPELGRAGQALRALEEGFLMTRSQAIKTLGDVAVKLREVGLSDVDFQAMLSFIPQASQNLAAYIGNLNAATEAQEAMIRAIQTGMTRSLVKYGIIIDTQSESFKELVQRIKKTNGVSDDYAKKLAIIIKLQEQASKVKDSFAGMKDSLAVQWDSLKNNIKEIYDIAAKLFGEIISPIIKGINNFLTPAVKSILGSLGGMVALWGAVELGTHAVRMVVTSILNSVVKTNENLGFTASILNAFEQGTFRANHRLKYMGKSAQELLNILIQMRSVLRTMPNQAVLMHDLNNTIKRAQYHLREMEAETGKAEEASKRSRNTVFINFGKISKSINFVTGSLFALQAMLSLTGATSSKIGRKISDVIGKIQGWLIGANILSNILNLVEKKWKINILKKLWTFLKGFWGWLKPFISEFKKYVLTAVSFIKGIGMTITTTVAAIVTVALLLEVVVERVIRKIKSFFTGDDSDLEDTLVEKMFDKIGKKIIGVDIGALDKAVQPVTEAEKELARKALGLKAKTAQVFDSVVETAIISYEEIQEYTEKMKGVFAGMKDRIDALDAGIAKEATIISPVIEADSLEAQAYKDRLDKKAIEIEMLKQIQTEAKDAWMKMIRELISIKKNTSSKIEVEEVTFAG